MIVPDGPLHVLPFGALVRRTDRLETDYLVEWKPLHQALSATVYAELRKSRPAAAVAGGDRHPVEVVAFGAPQYPGHLRNPEEREKIADFRVRSAVERGLFDWEPLPYSRQEVEGIARLYPAQKVRAYLREEASEERVKSLDGTPRILHLAVHGYLDDHIPLNSALALTIPEELGAKRDNGLLQAWEIFESVRIDADLVVLSACATGLGREQAGEGLIGLTRAFQYAGARSVVATLWNVSDRITAAFMVRFYHHLKRGLPKDAALRNAQIELIRGRIKVSDGHGRTEEVEASAPFYWAAFRLIGDWQ